MKKNNKSISRRGFIPLMGASLLMPFFSQTKAEASPSPKENDEFATLLTADGEVVRVKRSTLKKVKIIKKKMSNKSLLSWLKPKNKDNRR